MKFDAERSQIWSVFNALPLTDDIAFCRPNRGLHWTRLVPRPHRLGWTPSLFPLQPRLRNFISFLKTQHVGFWGLTAPVNPPTSGKPLMESLPFTNISCLPRSRPQEKRSQCVPTPAGPLPLRPRGQRLSVLAAAPPFGAPIPRFLCCAPAVCFMLFFFNSHFQYRSHNSPFAWFCPCDPLHSLRTRPCSHLKGPSG